MAKPLEILTVSQNVLQEQIAWLIRLRWLAVAGLIVVAAPSGHIFNVVADIWQLLTLTMILLASNILYAVVERGTRSRSGWSNRMFALVQVEADLLILTALLHFAGGPANPFTLFYLFHVIIATILLPLSLNLLVGVSAILFYGSLIGLQTVKTGWAAGQALAIRPGLELWREPVYAAGCLAAFAASVFLIQYLTRTIIIRMARKEWESIRHRELLETIIDAMSEGMFFVKPEGRIALCNSAARCWLHNPAKAGQLCLDDLPAALREPLRKLLISTAPEDRNGQVSFETQTSPPRYIETRTRAVSSQERFLGLVVVGRDLTRHRELLQSLRRRNDETASINEFLKTSQIEMAHREKMAAIGQMASGIAHEIGNPLASLSSVVQYLKRRMPQPDYAAHLDTIEVQVNRISLILKRMLTLSRPGSREYKWSDVNAMVENVLSLVQYDGRAENVEIRTFVGSNLPTVWVNPVHFEQVLLNLTVNALDAIAARQTQQKQYIEVRTGARDGQIELSIRDTGIGMDPETCRRAFESFFTTKELGKGTGLGLFITRNLLAEIDGAIHLESEPGVGTTAHLRIPLQPRKHLINSELPNEDQNTVS